MLSYLNIVVPKDMGTSSYQHFNRAENPAQARFKAESYLMHNSDLGGDVVATFDIGDINTIRDTLITSYEVHVLDLKDLDRAPESVHFDPKEAKAAARAIRFHGIDVWVSKEHYEDSDMFWDDPQECQGPFMAQCDELDDDAADLSLGNQSPANMFSVGAVLAHKEKRHA